MAAQAALFDVDGTLVDSVDLHARAWQEAFAHFGKRVPFDEVRAQIGKGGDQLIPVFLSEDEVARVGEELDHYRSQLYQREYLKRVRPFPQVRSLFEEVLRRGIRIALATSSKGEELETYKKMLEIEDLVHGETSASQTRHSKPEPDIFRSALAQLGKDIDLRRTIAIGDTPWDAIAAHRLGVRTIGVLCGGFAEADLRKAGCIAIYRDPAHLLARIDESPLVTIE